MVKAPDLRSGPRDGVVGSNPTPGTILFKFVNGHPVLLYISAVLRNIILVRLVTVV